MVKQIPFSLSLFLLLSLLHCSTTQAQSPAQAPAAPSPPAPVPTPPVQVPAGPALAPAPPGPTNLTKILEKASQFTVFIRLLKTTSVADQLYGELNNSNNGRTIFAPTDSAFSSLKTGTLNSLNEPQKLELVQFHVVPQFIGLSQFQTVSNPLRTNAGDSGSGRFPFNVTTSGSSVNITTGLTNASVSGTVYSDGQLAVYQVDRVLLPLDIFIPKPPAPAPAPEKPKKKAAAADSPVDSVNASGAVSLIMSLTMQNVAFFGVVNAIIAVLICL